MIVPQRGKIRLMSDFKIGKFQVVSQLGTGAHSSILQIRRSADGKTYALKVVPVHEPEDQKYIDQAQHEHRVSQLLEHPHLIKVYAFETVRDWFFRVKKAHLLIEYVNGKTLDICPRIPMPQLVQIFKAVADALVHMHRRQVYHADLKPNNIMLSRAGAVKVIDYGLAWIKGEFKGRVQGTPEYMAPEQGRKKIVNERTDFFNFGATMYRMVTWRLPPSAVPTEGELPIDENTYARLLKPAKSFAPSAPEALCDLIHRCMAFKPVNRPERASDIQDDLAKIVKELVTSRDERLEAYRWEF
jgi:serine/threonine protein kinase